MNIEEAKRIIWNDDASPIAWMAATGVIVSSPENNSALFADLIQCLKRGGGCRGPAVATLYARSKRAVPENLNDYCRNAEEWEMYLIKEGLLD